MFVLPLWRASRNPNDRLSPGFYRGSNRTQLIKRTRPSVMYIYRYVHKKFKGEYGIPNAFPTQHALLPHHLDTKSEVCRAPMITICCSCLI